MLFIVATPIGNPKDITLRALEILQEAEIVIGEERRISSTLLKKLNIPEKELYFLNEHSTDADVLELTEFCKDKKVALISDCGTPSFYDPGYQLVHQCRKRKIPVTAIPGVSSLMTLLSLVSEKVTQFYFAGFLPADNEVRPQRLKQILLIREPIVLMDTPYRLVKLLTELEGPLGARKMLLALNLTQEDEATFEGTAHEILETLKYRQIEKAEFILMIYGQSAPAVQSAQVVPKNESRYQKARPAFPSRRK